DQVDKEVAQHIIKLISKADKFPWVYHKCNRLKNSISFTYYCNCHVELKNKKARVDDISNRRDTMSRIDRYECNGTIQINIEHAYNLAIDQILNEKDKVFCKKNFREKILQLVRIHFSWHPIIPIERPPNFLSMNQIWIESVKEQYNYCYQNDLKHVWVYLWSEWYHPDKWKLWARASSSELNILRSKMTIEKFYPLLKIKEENAFADLPENLHLAFENLNYNYYTNEATAHNDDPQVDIDNQEKSVATAYNNDPQVDVDVVSSNNQEMNISNQDAILYQT
ncbi:19417_t:CDS:2, partial [Racocetra fulgida]